MRRRWPKEERQETPHAGAGWQIIPTFKGLTKATGRMPRRKHRWQ